MTEDKKDDVTPNFTKGHVNPTDLQSGVTDSDSVRRLQHVLKVDTTGDYDVATRRAVQRWRVANDLPAGRGTSVDGDQASRILGREYTVSDE